MEGLLRPQGATTANGRRLFTAPVQAPRPTTTAANTSVETLYHHPSVKIVAFSVGVRPRDSSGSPTEPRPGSLPWSSPIERTLAGGSLQIYRAPGSVAFLNCGPALQPILPKSQCWCVDEQSSQFVLQIRRPLYWRIEVPVDDVEDRRRAHLLREVLDKILQFEKTECPFTRTFTVELPARPDMPVKRRPWTPVRKYAPALPLTPITPGNLNGVHEIREWEPSPTQSERVHSAPLALDADAPRPDITASIDEASRVEQALTGRPSEDIESSASDEQVHDTQEPAEEGHQDDVGKEEKEEVGDAEEDTKKAVSSLRRRPATGSFPVGRSFTAPPLLSLIVSPPSKSAIAESGNGPDSGAENTQLQSSQGSLQSWHSSLTPLPPSPPESNPESPTFFSHPHENVPLPQSTAAETSSAITKSTRSSSEEWRIMTADEPALSGPSLINDGALEEHSDFSEMQEPDTSPVSQPPARNSLSEPTVYPSQTDLTDPSRLRHRATILGMAGHRALSVMPPVANLILIRPRTAIAEAAHTKLKAVRQLPITIIQKTCEILLSPPSHLINLMLRVAERIKSGVRRGSVLGTTDNGEKIPVRWDWSDSDDEGDGQLDGWGADDDWPATLMSASGMLKMAGSFPSDDDDEYDGGAKSSGREAASWGVD